MRETVGQAPRLRTGALAGPPAVGRQGVGVFNGAASVSQTSQNVKHPVVAVAGGASCATHRGWDNRGHANLGSGDRIVEEKPARHEVMVSSHEAPASHRIHSREVGDEFNRLRGAPPHILRKLGKHFRNPIRKEYDHRLLRRLTSSQLVKRPSRKPRSPRSFWASNESR